MHYIINMQRANSLPATRQQFRHFYRASAPQCWRAARCWYSNAVGLFVCLSHFSTVSKQLNILSYSLQHMVTQPIFTKFGRSHPLRRRWIQVGYIYFAIFGYHYKSLWHYRQLDLELESWKLNLNLPSAMLSVYWWRRGLSCCYFVCAAYGRSVSDS